jgi:siderophore synthetase component
VDSLVLDSPAAAVAGDASLAALLRCCVREVAGPRGQVWEARPYLLFRLAGTLIKVRTGGGIALRLAGAAEWLEHGTWRPLALDRLVALVGDELGGRNEEFAAQVAASREAIAVMLVARADAAPPDDPWLASEQSLVFGHPFHPTPKARGGSGWLAHAPEAHASFPLRLLGVREDLLVTGGDTTALDRLGTAPPGYALLPAHPWQLDLLGPALTAPLADGRLLDLGTGSLPVVPTSSVRTVYEPATGTCLKFSLDVRITNCVRKNAWYELEGAVALTELLTPVFGDLATRFTGTRWLPEPGYRSADLGRRLLEGLGVILRAAPHSVTTTVPLLAASLAIPASLPVADPARWWRAYVERVALPVLDAYFGHGVVLEPHLQNVLVGLDASGLPAEAVFRDLEGTKLLRGHHPLAALPPAVAESLTYTAEQGWDRVVYCLFVNHLPEIAATLAADEDALGELWVVAGEVLGKYAESRGAPLPLKDLLAGAPLPAKANLSVRWARSADRTAGYVSVANPFAGLGLR